VEGFGSESSGVEQCKWEEAQKPNRGRDKLGFWTHRKDGLKIKRSNEGARYKTKERKVDQIPGDSKDQSWSESVSYA